ncbi:ABC transporter substrate-binding protein [Paenibacillus sp. MY03]|uniref:extracellular solute-binding protein n=1 Tax=Paenibacillus sp. MY03 TaxID=302980 RepID=UPI000B3D1F6F|nr:extracellular solute-binding protein [Paenibacillus sp. MY03]OUS75043.1 ABC transporter substrate-binding protein [Paenibacillus sp. MY03]
MRKPIVSVGIGVILLAVLAACGTNNDEGKEAGAEEKTQITLWHNFNGNDLRSLAMRSLIETFQINNPQIELKVEKFVSDGYRAKVMEAAKADNLPDVFVMWSGSMTSDFAQAGLIQPINELLGEYPEWRDGFMPGSLEAFTEGGNTYSAPMGLTPTSILYYNKSIFLEQKLTVPQTWEQLLDVIRKLNDKGIAPIALGNKAGWVAQSSIFSSLADRVTGTDWFMKAIAQEGAAYTDRVFVDALTYMQELAEAGAFQKGYANMDNLEMELLFARGEAAMMIDGGWALTNMAANATNEELRRIGATVLPSMPEGLGNSRSVSGVTGIGMGLGSKAQDERKEAALALIYAMSGPEAQRKTLESNQLVSYKIDLDRNKVSSIFAEVYELVTSVDFTPVYDVYLSSETAEVLNEGLKKLLAGTAEPEEVAASLQEAHVRSAEPARSE